MMYAVGALVSAIGVFVIWGSMMSDAPYEAEKSARGGAITFGVGIAIIIATFCVQHFHLIK